MAEKEKAPSYEAASATGQQHGKPANLQLPSLAGKQQATCGGRNKDSHQQNDSDKPTIESYYLNIAQKGKLMLPTALWVMLIIAGICFLTLLVSLNKSIGTLETIVELEQAKEARAEANERLHHNHHYRRADDNTDSDASSTKGHDGADKKKKKNVKSDNNSNNKDRQHKSKHHEQMLGEMSEGDIRSIELGLGDSDSPMGGSWFELPSWTSLEPKQREQGMFESGMLLSPPSMPPMALLNDLLDNIVSGPVMGRDKSEPEMSGSIIMTSGPLIDVIPEGPSDDLPSGGFMDSIFKTLPIFDSIISGNVDEPNPRYTHKGRLAPQLATDEDDDKPGTLVIAPKIENLNVNFGTVHMDGMPESESEGEQPKEEPKKQPTTEEEINSLEKSIDDLVLRLIDQKSNPKFGADRQQVDEAVPIVKHHYGNFQNPNHKRPMHSDHSPKSPIANLLSPFSPFDSLSSSLSGPIFFQTIDGGDDLSQLLSKQQGSLKSHQNRRPLEDQDDATQLLISISGEQDPMSIEDRFSKASGETNRHGVSNTRRPSFGQSPYEVPMSPQLVIDDLMDPFAFGQQSKFGNRPHNEHHRVTKAKADKGSSDAEWDMFANGLADSLIQNMLPRPRQPPVSSDEPQIIMIDSNMPLAPGEQRNIFETFMMPDSLFPGMDIVGTGPSKRKENKQRPSNKKEPVNETTDLILAPKRKSFANVVEELMQAQKLIDNATQKPSVASTGKPSVNNADVPTEPTTTAPSTTTSSIIASTEESARTTTSPQASTSADTDRPTSQQPTNGNEDTPHRKEAEEIITGIMDDLFTTPQFGDNQQQSSTVILLPSSVTPSI